MSRALKVIPYGKISLASNVNEGILKRVKKLIVHFRNEQAIANVVTQANRNGAITIPSIYSNATASCSFSIVASKKNFLKFVDPNGEEFYVVQNPLYFLYGIYLPKENIIFSTVSSQVQTEKMLQHFWVAMRRYADVIGTERNRNFLGIINAYPRPYHYFRDKLTILLGYERVLKGVPILTLEKEAFLSADVVPGAVEKVVTGDLNDYLQNQKGFAIDLGGSFNSDHRQKMLSATQKMRTYSVAKYMEDAEILKSIKGGGPIIWFGICAEKRSWINQNEILAEIMEKTSDLYPDVVYVFDGMTAPVGVDENEFKNTTALREVEKLKDILGRVHTRAPIRYLSLVGVHADKKICVADKIDFFLTSALTDSIWVAHFNRKRGIAYLSNAANIQEHNHPKTYIIPKKYVTDSALNASNWSTIDYSIDSNFVCNSFLAGLEQWVRQKQLGNQLYSFFPTKDKATVISTDCGGQNIEINLEKGESLEFSIGDNYANFNRSAKALPCLSRNYEFILDIEATEGVDANLLVVGYSAGNKADSYSCDTRRTTIQFNDRVDRFRVFMRLAGKGNVNFFGYSAQPISGLD